MSVHTEHTEVGEEVPDGTGGRGGRLNSVWPEAQRERLLAALSRTEPAWKDEDHPELVELGTYRWVRTLREKGWRSPEIESPAPEQQ